MARKPHSFVDALALQLGGMIGADVKVLRGRAAKGTLYQIAITRGERVMLLNGMNQQMRIEEAKKWLATLNDMVAQGSILTMPPDATVAETLSLRRHWETVRTLLILMDQV